jgi:glycosyltransferase involved in cell wall biosynthesis
MHVFLVPSWYPEPEHGLMGGVFLAEAAQALARHAPGLDVSVSLWGQGDLELSSGRIRAWLARRSGPGRAGSEPRALRENLTEYYCPAWTWRHGLAKGNLAGMLRSNRQNLTRATAERGLPDLIHAHVSWPAGAVAMQLSRESRIPYIVTEHMSPFPFRHLVRDGKVVPEVREPLRNAARVTAVSRSLATEIRERVGVDATVIPNGVDGEWFSPAPVSRDIGREFTYLTVANLTPQKGIDDLLAAIALWGRTVRGVRFRIAGGGSHAAEYRALAERLEVSHRVTWLGPLSRERVRDEMRACDAFVLPSRHESFGVVFAEAIACGKPVLGTRCGGPEDIVDATNGELVPVGDVRSLAAGLKVLFLRAHELDPATIRADFEARFSSAAVARRFGELYTQVVGGTR